MYLRTHKLAYSVKKQYFCTGFRNDRIMSGVGRLSSVLSLSPLKKEQLFRNSVTVRLFRSFRTRCLQTTNNLNLNPSHGVENRPDQESLSASETSGLSVNEKNGLSAKRSFSKQSLRSVRQTPNIYGRDQANGSYREHEKESVHAQRCVFPHEQTDRQGDDRQVVLPVRASPLGSADEGERAFQESGGGNPYHPRRPDGESEAESGVQSPDTYRFALRLRDAQTQSELRFRRKRNRKLKIKN